MAEVYDETEFSDDLVRREGAFEDRQCPRRAYNQLAKILIQGGTPSEILICDLSNGGMGASLSHSVQVGHSCIVAIEVFIDDRFRKINLWGTVVYCIKFRESFRIGIKYRDHDTMSRRYLSQLCG